MGALSHLRVLDLTRVLAGPWCTQTLADLGAEVIKIERPHAGDDTRHWGPPYAKDAEGNDTTEAAYYLAVNRNKKSVTLDISTPQGQALIAQLVAEADVLVENYKVGQLAKYGLDYESLKAIKSNLIYCSITGFGQTGPYARRPGYDFIVQGLGGFMSVTGERDDLLEADRKRLAWPSPIYSPGPMPPSQSWRRSSIGTALVKVNTWTSACLMYRLP